MKKPDYMIELIERVFVPFNEKIYDKGSRVIVCDNSTYMYDVWNKNGDAIPKKSCRIMYKLE